MTETPERIWAEPGMPGYTDEPNEVYTVEYVHHSLLDEAVKAAYLAGFNASAEGWNGEYPFQDNNASPSTDADWLKQRDADLAALGEGE